MSEQPEALRLADELDDLNAGRNYDTPLTEAAAELRRLHGEVAAMNQRADEIHKWYDVLLDRAEQAEAEVERLRALLIRYRTETPLGHQPHMIAHEVDAALKEPK